MLIMGVDFQNRKRIARHMRRVNGGMWAFLEPMEIIPSQINWLNFCDGRNNVEIPIVVHIEIPINKILCMKYSIHQCILIMRLKKSCSIYFKQDKSTTPLKILSSHELQFNWINSENLASSTICAVNQSTDLYARLDRLDQSLSKKSIWYERFNHDSITIVIDMIRICVITSPYSKTVS